MFASLRGIWVSERRQAFIYCLFIQEPIIGHGSLPENHADEKRIGRETCLLHLCHSNRCSESYFFLSGRPQRQTGLGIRLSSNRLFRLDGDFSPHIFRLIHAKASTWKTPLSQATTKAGNDHVPAEHELPHCDRSSERELPSWLFE